uniref:Uncharacterized protein n=1 Tax=Leersia perrieri TaxID=77586 RepID=A0A0D9Y1W5_9ORYZ
MGLSRRIQNLIVDNPYSGTKWLRSIDLTRHLFGNGGKTAAASSIGDEGSSDPALADDSIICQTTVADSKRPKSKIAAARAALKMERIRFSSPIVRFTCTKTLDYAFIDCFPLSDRNVVMADQTGCTFLFDADTRRVLPKPNLHKTKWEPISLFVPSVDPSDGGILYVMERVPKREKEGSELSDQFEAFVCDSKPSPESQWHCHLLPPPPFVCDLPAGYSTPR